MNILWGFSCSWTTRYTEILLGQMSLAVTCLFKLIMENGDSVPLHLASVAYTVCYIMLDNCFSIPRNTLTLFLSLPRNTFTMFLFFQDTGIPLKCFFQYPEIPSQFFPMPRNTFTMFFNTHTTLAMFL